MRIWIIYCWHDIHERHLPRVSGIKEAIESAGVGVRLECMDFTIGEKLYKQINEKVFELKIYSNLAAGDSCIFMIPHEVLSDEDFLKEQAYLRSESEEHPQGSNPCVGLMYL